MVRGWRKAVGHDGAPAAGGAAAPLLELCDVHFGYDAHREVLSGVSLELARGECLCLMGPNGCGKSTLIDCILGENKPSAGTIALDGRDALGLSAIERARLISYVPQVHDRTFPYTVEHVVLMGRTARAGMFAGPGTDADRELVAKALAACGIAELAEKPYTSLSGGEMQMVMLARALVQDAPLMVMDEPTAHLDFRNELLFLETLEGLVRERGVTVLMATHAPNQAFHLEAADVPTRVALMGGGRVESSGRPHEVLTEQALLQVFGVEGRLVELDLANGESVVRQVVPLRTSEREG